MPWALLWNNKGIVGVLILILGIGGYIWYLRADVVRHEKENTQLREGIAVVNGDLQRAKAAISNIEEAMKQYQKWTEKSIAGLKDTNARISMQTNLIRKILDNLVVPATEARRIIDAPRVPFFAPDGYDNLVSMDNGVFTFRVRRVPLKADADYRPGGAAVDPGGAVSP
jgi:hypothetical protein